MNLFKKKVKEEFVKTEPTKDMIKAVEVKKEPIEEEIISEEFEDLEEDIEEPENKEESIEDEKEKIKKQLSDIQRRKEENKKEKELKDKEMPKVLIRERAVPVEFMFNNLSDRIEGIEMYLIQLDKFLKNKFK